MSTLLGGMSRIEDYSKHLLTYFFSIGSVLFYISWAVCVHLLTTDRRTESKRLVLFGLAGASCVFEVMARRLWPDMSTGLLWQVRSTVCLASVGTIVWAAFTHHDRIEAMEKEIAAIRQLLVRQNGNINVEVAPAAQVTSKLLHFVECE